jgi:site-specific recombinase XerC
LEDERSIDKRDAAIVHLMLHAGLSKNKIVRADVEDLEQTLIGWTLRVQGKSRTVNDEQVPSDKIAVAPTQHYLDARSDAGSTDPVFTSHGW